MWTLESAAAFKLNSYVDLVPVHNMCLVLSPRRLRKKMVEGAALFFKPLHKLKAG